MEWDNETIVRQIQTRQGNRNELLEKLWNDNIRLIRKIIHEMTGLDRDKWSDRQDFEDLEQQAFIGLLDSVHRYDITKGIKFFSFAPHYIRLSIYRYYDQSGQTLRIPAYMRHNVRAYLQERERQKTATDKSIQETLGMSDKSFQETVKTVQKMELIRLDNYLNDSDKESGTLLDMLASTENVSETALSGSYNRELHNLLRSALGELPEKERQAIIARHYARHNTGHIANEMNCSRQNVSRLIKSGYKRIRTGKYATELLTFLPERAISHAQKRIQDDFKELSQQERDLLI